MGRIEQKYQTIKATALYGDYYYINRNAIKRLLEELRGKKIAIWGGGLKGEAFLQIIDPDRKAISFVVDKNEKKCGTVMSTGHKVIAPKSLKEFGIQVVLTINYNHADSVQNEVETLSDSIEVICLDLYLLRQEKSWEENGYQMNLKERVVSEYLFFRDRFEAAKRNIINTKSIGKGTDDNQIGKSVPIFFYYGQCFSAATKDNNGEAYGLFACLKRYSGYSKHIYARAEHGLYFHCWPYFSEVVESNVPMVFTYSQKRKNAIQHLSNRLAYPVGPYIHYGNVLYSDFQISAIKENLGKTLLVFPEHSTPGALISVKTEEGISKIKDIKERYGFDSVLVCFHYWDIIYGKYFRYMKEGWIPVTAGIGFHENFYDNLKTLITLSDFCLMSGLGTSLGYCVYLNKPCMLYNQPDEITYKRDKNTNQPLENMEHYLDLDNDEQILTAAFSEYHDVLTEEQYRICRKIWGFDSVRTPHEIKNTLEVVRKIALNAPKTESGYRTYAKKLLQQSNNKVEMRFLNEIFGKKK